MTVSFKTLDWIVRGQSAEVPVIYAGAFGIDRFYSVKGTPGNWTLSYPGADCMTHLDGFQTQSAARKAAQADYEARAIVPLIFSPPSTHVRVSVDRLVASIVTGACELDGPADPSSDDTISITMKDLEAVVHRHVTAALERQP